VPSAEVAGGWHVALAVPMTSAPCPGESPSRNREKPFSESRQHSLFGEEKLGCLQTIELQTEPNRAFAGLCSA
jgi:hypothetical protein